MFENPIKQKKIRKYIYAYKYINGVINIEGTKYLCHSMTSAIKQYRKDNPL